MVWLVAWVLSVDLQEASCVDTTARPFVCARTDSDGASLHWDPGAATYYIDDVASRDEPIVQAAFAAWASIDGVSFTATYGGASHGVAPGYDLLDLANNRNVVYFSQAWLHDSAQRALTTLTFDASSGAILDADIELNDVNTPLGDGDSTEFVDLGSVVTHEVGHWVGFGHADENPELDPTCAVRSTMFSQVEAGQSYKRTPQPTDRAGMRFVYPAGQPVGLCFTDASPPPHLTVRQLPKGCAATDVDVAWFALLIPWLWRRWPLLALPLLACGPAPATGARVTHFAYERQVAGDPLSLVFRVGFAAPGGCGGAVLSFDLNDKPQVDLNLCTLVSERHLGETSERGEVAAVLKLNQAPTKKTQVRVGVMLVDGQGARSQRFEVTLELQ